MLLSGEPLVIVEATGRVRDELCIVLIEERKYQKTCSEESL